MKTSCDEAAGGGSRPATQLDSEASGGVREPKRPFAASPFAEPEGGAAGGKLKAVALRGEAGEWEGANMAGVAKSIECGAAAADAMRSVESPD